MFLLQLLVALKTLWKVGILHTDIKPDNVMLVNSKNQPLRIKLIDFGLAILISKANPGMVTQPIGYRYLFLHSLSVFIIFYFKIMFLCHRRLSYRPLIFWLFFPPKSSGNFPGPPLQRGCWCVGSGLHRGLPLPGRQPLPCWLRLPNGTSATSDKRTQPQNDFKLYY